jgi:hypothetical protein
MKKLLYSLSGLGLVSLLVMGTSVSSSYAGDNCQPKSPVRGTWSFSQSAQSFNSAPPLFIPITEVGTANIDACGNLTGQGISNDPAGGSEFPFDGKCELRENGDNVMDCTFHALGQTNSEVCVLMEKTGECFQEFRCVLTRPYDPTQPGIVLLAEVKRAQNGTCK